MRKNIVSLMFLALFAGSSMNANAQSSLLGKIGSAVASVATQSGSDKLSALTSVFNNALVPTKDQIIGSWTYSEPAVVFTSDNTLQKFGGKVASAAIEKKLQSQLEKYGFKAGKMTMTYDAQGNFSQTVSGKTVKGTYTIQDSNVVLKYGGRVSQVVGKTQLIDGDLVIVMDASKLLSYMKTLGTLTKNSTLSTASSLISGFSGMQVGIRLKKTK